VPLFCQCSAVAMRLLCEREIDNQKEKNTLGDLNLVTDGSHTTSGHLNLASINRQSPLLQGTKASPAVKRK
jgi:hypothetical protein